MLTHPTLQILKTMKLEGMAQALQGQLDLGQAKELGFEKRLGLLVDREATHRENKGFARRLRIGLAGLVSHRCTRRRAGCFKSWWRPKRTGGT